MAYEITLKDLHEWCSIPVGDLENHPKRLVPFKIAEDSAAMGEMMAKELVDEIISHNEKNEPARAIIPCGPKSWYEPFTRMVNEGNVSLSFSLDDTTYETLAVIYSVLGSMKQTMEDKFIEYVS